VNTKNCRVAVILKLHVSSHCLGHGNNISDELKFYYPRSYVRFQYLQYSKRIVE